MKNKILSLILVVALVVCGATAIVKNNEAATVAKDLTAANETNTTLSAEIETLTAQIAELEAAAEAAAADTTAADLQAQLDEATAKIAELEAAAEAAAAEAETAAANEAAAEADLQSLVDLYKPYYDAQVIIEYNGGVIMKDEVLEAYAVYENAAAQYGIDLVSYGMDAQYKELAANDVLEQTVLFNMAAELGLDQIDEATLASLNEEANANFESFIATVSPNFQAEGVSDEEVRTQSIEYLESAGYSLELLTDAIVENYLLEQVYNHITAGVTVSDEDVEATFANMVAEQEGSFADDSSYNDARNNGELIVWNPEGYRAVKHVLVQLSDEQSASVSELNSTLSSLNAELEAAQAPAEETEETTEEETAEETTEEETAPRTVEEITADIEATQAAIDAVYAELLPEVNEVIEKFNAGTAFADLIAEYNDDPGMTNEPTATNGYAVAAASTIWDPAFRDGAMSIANVGEISEPVYGSYGIHVIYYESDIPAGAVELDSIRETIAATALEEKMTSTYNEAIIQLLADAAPVYHLENLD